MNKQLYRVICYFKISTISKYQNLSSHIFARKTITINIYKLQTILLLFNQYNHENLAFYTT